jgi:drug/metabolite transporter (DMT)-like permease
MENSRLALQVSGRVYLMIAIAIFGAANAVTRKLTEVGAQHLIAGRNLISFCHVLFVGHICALVLLLVIYHRQWLFSQWRQITLKQWLTLTLITLLSATLAPMLIFTALAITGVNTVILLSQINTPLVLALSVVFLGERVNGWVVSGALLAFVGVALTVLLQAPGDDMMTMGMGITLGRGELLTLIATVFSAIASVISKVSLQQIPLGIFNVYRMAVGTVFFFMATLVLFEPSHFRDVTSPFLWQWMVLYSAVIVVGGQLAWLNGLKRSTASEISLATAFTPIAGVLAAFLILGEVPTLAQYIGGAVIVLGIALNQVGVQRLNQTAPEQKPSLPELSQKVAYKGV